MNLPVSDFIFSNPDWVTLPMRICIGGIFLILFLLSLRYGPSGAVETVKRYRWPLVVALVAAAGWGIYGSIVLGPSSLFG
jgi:hypothetical protein